MIHFSIKHFIPLQDVFVVSYAIDEIPHHITLNLSLPIVNNKYLEGADLENFILGFAPREELEKIKAIYGVDSSHIEAMIGVPVESEPDSKQEIPIHYLLAQFEPLNGVFAICYYTPFFPDGITLNLLLPIEDNHYLDGDALDVFIRQSAPIEELERKNMIAQLDSSFIEAMVQVPE